MNKNTSISNSIFTNTIIVSFHRLDNLSFIHREFSSGRVIFKPSRVDVSVISDNTTERDLREHKENQARKMEEFKDRHSEDELYAKTAIFDSMDKDKAEALRDEIKSDLISDTAKLKEELREDVGEIIDNLTFSTFLPQCRERLITEQRDHLKVNLEDADKVCDERLLTLDDSWFNSKHAEEDIEMSSVGSYEDSDDNEDGPNKGDGNNNSGNTNVANEGNNNSNTNNRDIDSELSPLDFIIEKENSTSIYAVEILNIDESF